MGNCFTCNLQTNEPVNPETISDSKKDTDDVKNTTVKDTIELSIKIPDTNTTIPIPITPTYITQKVALKLPNGKTCLLYNEIKQDFIYSENINKWIKSLYDSSHWTGWLVYNDEAEDIGYKAHKKGHCKGILAWNDTHISWLVHSVPNFPREFNGASISDIENSELIYGQSFLYIENVCDTNFLEKAISQIYHMEANIYMKHNDLCKITIKDDKLHTLLFSNAIIHFSKSPHCEIDIYSEHIIKYETCTWYVETWKRGHEIKTNTNVVEIKNIQWKNISYKESQDHSKWAISDTYYWIGDLNRMTSQYKRGGGGFLIKNKEISNAFRKLILN